MMRAMWAAGMIMLAANVSCFGDSNDALGVVGQHDEKAMPESTVSGASIDSDPKSGRPEAPSDREASETEERGAWANRPGRESIRDIALSAANHQADLERRLRQWHEREPLRSWDASLDNPPAGAPERYLLAQIYNWGVRDYGTRIGEVLALLASSCEDSFHPACFSIGMMEIELGHPSRALPYLRRAADGGYVPAMVNLGNLLVSGDGVPVDHEEGRWWLSKAAALGAPGIPLRLGISFIETRDFDKAIEALSSPEASKDPQAVNWLAVALYSRGDMSDATRIRDLLERADQGGDTHAARNLALLYEDGFGEIAADSAKARYWRAKAASASTP